MGTIILAPILGQPSRRGIVAQIIKKMVFRPNPLVFHAKIHLRFGIPNRFISLIATQNAL
jgi:hypothetical protein